MHYICLVVLSSQTLQVTLRVFKVARCVHGTGTKYVCYSTRKLRFEHRNRLSLLRARITLYTFDDTDRFRSGTNTLI